MKETYAKDFGVMEALSLLAELADASSSFSPVPAPTTTSSSSCSSVSSFTPSPPSPPSPARRGAATVTQRACTFPAIPRVERACASPSRLKKMIAGKGLGTPDVNKTMRGGTVATPPSALSLARSTAASAAAAVAASSMHASKPVGRLVCCVCKYSTNHTSHMRRHIRAHAGDKPYACQKCSYRCAQRANLKRHIRSRHTGERPFVCPFCVYKSAQKSHIQGHIRSRHPSKDPASVIVLQLPPVVAATTAAGAEKETTINIPASGVAAEVSTARSNQKKRKAELHLLAAKKSVKTVKKKASARSSPTGVQELLE